MPRRPAPPDLEAAAAALAAAGFLAPEEESELLAAAAVDADDLRRLVTRRGTGEPLAWITGWTTFAGIRVRVDPGVYVPRPQTEHVAAAAARRLPTDGVAIDACCGSGAIALALQAAQPTARVLALDVDDRAVACARSNGVDAHRGDLLGAVPAGLRGRVDVVVASVPYVPTDRLPFLARDTLAFESTRSYDGGPDGLDLLRRLAHQAHEVLAPEGSLLVEVGIDQIDAAVAALAAARFGEPTTITDEDGEPRGLAGRRLA